MKSTPSHPVFGLPLKRALCAEDLDYSIIKINDMKILHVALVVMLLFGLLAGALFSSIVIAGDVRLTLYDDGLSCPGGCDSHVVFHSSINGTQYAHHPNTKKEPFKRCSPGESCEICFSSDRKQCMEVMYRGGGPSPMTFDFTPRFYSEHCPSTANYPALQAKCSELKAGEQSLAGRVNCIKDPEATKCSEKMSAAIAAANADKIDYDACRTIGEVKFNGAQPKEKQRALACAYEKYGTGGPNSKGTTWRKLLPGACREETFVGRDGLDCCSGVPFVDGPLGRECRSFYPK